VEERLQFEGGVKDTALHPVHATRLAGCTFLAARFTLLCLQIATRILPAKRLCTFSGPGRGINSTFSITSLIRAGDCVPCTAGDQISWSPLYSYTWSRFSCLDRFRCPPEAQLRVWSTTVIRTPRHTQRPKQSLSASLLRELGKMKEKRHPAKHGGLA